MAETFYVLATLQCYLVRKRVTIDGRLVGLKARRNGIHWIVSAACDTPYRLLCFFPPSVVLGAKRKTYTQNVLWLP